MRSNEIASLDRRPPAVAEWEDLLVKMEIMPRVLRNTLEGAPLDDAPLAEVLRELVARERRTMHWLQAVADPSAEAAAAAGEADELPLAFASLRARCFAMVQRRGLEVWDWTGPLPDGTPATVYQVLTWLVREDVRALAALRARAGAATGPC